MLFSKLSLFAPDSRQSQSLSPGAYFLPDLLSQREQIELLLACRQSLAELKAKGYDLERQKFINSYNQECKTGARIASLGCWWTLDGYKTSVVPIPEIVCTLANRAIAEVGMLPLPSADKVSAIMQHYDCYADSNVKLGMHRDDTEPYNLLQKLAPPVVSFSLGCEAIFLWGGKDYQSPPQEIELRSGDVVIFGERSRLNYHGIKKVIPNTEPPYFSAPFKGRLNVTVRQAVAIHTSQFLFEVGAAVSHTIESCPQYNWHGTVVWIDSSKTFCDVVWREFPLGTCNARRHPIYSDRIYNEISTPQRYPVRLLRLI